MAKMTAKQIELEKRYNEYITDQAGLLHNKITAFIGESKVPLIQAMLVLEMVLEECKRQCYDKYLGANNGGCVEKTSV